MKSGFIAIIGRPNVGKSSLLNAILGTKVTIVSPKPQTTRRKITGVLTQDDTQLVFTDTPGIFKPRNSLGDYMMHEVEAAAQETDIIMLVLDAKDGLTQNDKDILEQYKQAKVIVALNKTDIAKPEQVLPTIERLKAFSNIAEIVPVSAITKDNIDVLINLLKNNVSDDIFYYPQDQITDLDLTERISEVIREKAMYCLQQEIPHGVAVEIERYSDDRIAEIDALIVCEKDNHKGMIIGAKGAMLKKIGSMARTDIENMLNKKVFLTLYVKVINDWRERKNILYDLGYKN